MIWVTRDHVHLDRVASPWLIRRFIDPKCEFVFVPFGTQAHPALDGIAFALPGAELPPHDESGSTFRKILQKYRIQNEALDMMADIIESGIAHVLSELKSDRSDPGRLKCPEGIGLSALSHGMIFVAEDDADNIEKSSVIYDALYAFCRAKLIEAQKPEICQQPFPQRWNAMKAELSLQPITVNPSVL